jgi:enoyl-CoA hydratase
MTGTGSHSPGKVLFHAEGNVGWIVLDNPSRRNAVSLSMWQSLSVAVQRFESDEEIRCIVVRGEGTRSFCAGADISEFEQHRSDRQANAAYGCIAYGAMERLQRLPKPTLAMIVGHCIGGGVALALSCDLRIGAVGSRYAIPAARLGVGYDYANIERLTGVVGPSKAKQLLFTGMPFQAEEAHRIGLIDELVPLDDVYVYTQQLATTIAGNAPLSVKSAKYATEIASRVATPDEVDHAKRLELACFESDDFVEGRRAFLEKRAPFFRGY